MRIQGFTSSRELVEDFERLMHEERAFTVARLNDTLAHATEDRDWWCGRACAYREALGAALQRLHHQGQVNDQQRREIERLRRGHSETGSRK